MSKTKSVDGYEVRLTRRRYSNRTFCWAEVMFQGTWLETGDPWPAVTPKHSELEQAVRETVALAKSRYSELVRLSRPFIEAYEDDLLVHDRNAILASPGVPYIHWTRDTGTWMTVLWPADSESYPPKGVSVPWLFGTAQRETILEQKVSLAEYRNNPLNTETLLCLYFNGKTLRKITTERAADIVADYERSVRRQWELALAVA